MPTAEVPRVGGWIEAGVVTVAVLVLRLPTMLLGRWYDPDEAAIAMQALAINRGGTLYVDMADRKPPLPPLIYEWIFRATDSTDPRPLRLVVGIMLAVAAVVVLRDVRRTHGTTVARWACALYVFGALAFAPVDAGAANYAHFALPVATVAMLFSRRRGLRWALGSGLILGLAILCRQSWVFALPAGIFSAWRAQAGATVGVAVVQRYLRAAPAAVLFAAGCAAGITTCALFVPFSDYWYWNFESNTGFVFASLSIGDVLIKGITALGLFLACHLALTAAVAAGARVSLRTDADLWAWLVTGIAAIAAGFRFYGHYWMQVLPPLVLLGAPVIASLGSRRRTLTVASVAICAVITWSLLFVPDVFRDHREKPGPVAGYIRDHTDAADRVFIWGSFPELSVESDRPAAGDLVHSDFVTGRSGGRNEASETLPNGSVRALEMMMSDLLGQPPELVVDTSGVASLGYGDYPLSVIPRLDQFVADNYATETIIGGFTILRLRSAPQS